MALEDFENSRAQGRPVELYYFRYGEDPSAFFAFTDAEEVVTYSGVDYIPHTITRGKVSSSQSLDKSTTDVRTSLDSPVAELFRVYAPSSVVTLIIRAGHVGDPDAEFAVIFTGRVQQCKRTAREATLSCVPASVSIRRSGLRRHYQLTCPHVLYDQDPGSCLASMIAGTINQVIVSALTYTSVTLPAGWNGALSADKFIGGMIVWAGAAGTERRTIIRRAGNVFDLNGPTTGLLLGAEISVILGCNHQLDDCETLHQNVVNYGGMPFIPSDNPVKSNPFS